MQSRWTYTPLTEQYCSFPQVGACIMNDDKKIVGIGYNGKHFVYPVLRRRWRDRATRIAVEQAGGNTFLATGCPLAVATMQWVATMKIWVALIYLFVLTAGQRFLDLRMPIGCTADDLVYDPFNTRPLLTCAFVILSEQRLRLRREL